MAYYSLDEIFHDYGQFDAPVELTFASDSESFNKYGRMLYGTFTYLVMILKQNRKPSSDMKTCTISSDIPKWKIGHK